ncbi:Glutamine-dependent NAD(+) synthetase [Cichlidogyrus casuarinus]|uniref:Glutamine-dependent NAD(+) synthetase n=1 Tax=Cichlidogyrus casuarinus TaxID=1844966 RepID=A0ABD2PZ14_9PLAT
MVLAYLMAQLIPWRDNSSGRLVLSAANLDETLRGYFTKYDCSSADLNPIGCISKRDIRAFVSQQCTEVANSPQLVQCLQDVLNAVPSAELEPCNSENQQTDEVDMGITYAELSLFGRLRKQQFCGPYTMLQRLLNGAWEEALNDGELESSQLASFPQARSQEFARFLCDRVQFFFRMFALNRHKSTVLPPACHVESYSADDNRYSFSLSHPLNIPVQLR